MQNIIIVCVLVLQLLSTAGVAQVPDLERIEPAFWWVGMKSEKLQLIVHGNQIAQRQVQIEYPGVNLDQVHQVSNPNYLFIDLVINQNTQPGSFDIDFVKKGKKAISYTYELKARNNERQGKRGVTDKDFIYLIMPDRFANGDTNNDIVPEMRQNTVARDSMYARHGGDLQGVIDHLDYLEDMGVTTLWLNPVLTNDQPSASYHGYANTENYEIDPRYGNNELYRALADSLHHRDMKLIMDLVHNHVGSKHWTILDLPEENWIHQWPEYTQTNYKDQVLFDPYASKADAKKMTDGWFDKHMPDMNQDNPFVRNYITQSHIWWIEFAGLDGFRLDTYAYNNAEYMAEWGEDIKREYPDMTFFGETWVHGIPNQAFFTQGSTLHQNLDTELPGVTDFQLLWGINEALTGEFGWTTGVNQLYTSLASDFVYQDPTRNVVFLDNHDLSRYFSVIGENFEKYKSGIAWLMTTRGIPQMYYGTEILMKNFADPDGKVREDFPGGWPTDSVNKYTDNGRTDKEQEAFQYVKTLAKYRKNHAVLQDGKLMQFIPEDAIYTYFRYNDTASVMIIMNTANETKEVETSRFQERLEGFTTAKNIISGEQVPNMNMISIPANTTLVLELSRK